MSCQMCDDAEESGYIAYYRWKNANIGVYGCVTHLREIFDALNYAQKELTTKESDDKSPSKDSD